MGMERSELRKRIAAIRMRAKRYIRGMRLGEWALRSAPGDGFEFNSLREYQEGDDIRRIDWHSSARSHRLMVRSYHESKRRTGVILLDKTASMQAGSLSSLKDEVMREVALMLGCIIEQEGGQVGLVHLDHHSYSMLPCQSKRSACENIYKAILGEQILMRSSHASMHNHLIACAQSVPRHALLFFITDGADELCTQVIKAFARRVHIVLVRVRDQHEVSGKLPCGLMVQDAETNKVFELMTSKQREAMSRRVQQWYDAQDRLLRSAKIPWIDIVAGMPYDKQLRACLEQGV